MSERLSGSGPADGAGHRLCAGGVDPGVLCRLSVRSAAAGAGLRLCAGGGTPGVPERLAPRLPADAAGLRLRAGGRLVIVIGAAVDEVEHDADRQQIDDLRDPTFFLFFKRGGCGGGLPGGLFLLLFLSRRFFCLALRLGFPGPLRLQLFPALRLGFLPALLLRARLLGLPAGFFRLAALLLLQPEVGADGADRGIVVIIRNGRSAVPGVIGAAAAGCPGTGTCDTGPHGACSRSRLCGGRREDPCGTLLQRLLHLCGAAVAGFRIGGAGLPDGFPERRRHIVREGYLRAGEPFHHHIAAVERRDRLRVGRLEGEAVVVREPVEHGPQGVKVHGAVVAGLPADDLRRHVVHGALLGVHRLGRAVHLSRDAEVAQDVGPELVDEDVGGLDVPVDDLLPFTGGEGVADVAADLHDLVRREALSGLEAAPGAFFETLEQRHADIDGVADAVRIALHMVVLDRHDVGTVLHAEQEPDLFGDPLGCLGVIVGDRLLVHAAVAQLLHLGGVLRDADDLQGGDRLQTQIIPPDLIDLAEASGTDQILRFACDVPVRPERKCDPAHACCLPLPVIPKRCS